jgi:hypothetical protein
MIYIISISCRCGVTVYCIGPFYCASARDVDILSEFQCLPGRTYIYKNGSNANTNFLAES